MKKLIKIGGQFSGVGAFDFALKRLGIEFENVYQAEWDKYARETYQLNHGTPEFYTKDVYDTPLDKIPKLDIAMFSPPCQTFSMAGGRKGEDDDRGVLFYNSHNFIKVNRPRFFIFENVKGLLSDDGGRTFQKWLDYLGGKSINGNVMLFPHDEAVPYHVYYAVLNAKNYGIPQNRERVFIIGIRDDKDNVFEFPKPEPLKKTLKDCLEQNVDEKYFLSQTAIEGYLFSDEKHTDFGGKFEPFEDLNVVAKTITEKSGGRKTDNFIKVKSNTTSGFEILEKGEDSLNLDQPNSETRRGRVGKKVAQTLTTSCNQSVFVVKQERTDEGKEKRSRSMKYDGVDTGNFKDKQIVFKEQSFSDIILANPNHKKEGLIMVKTELNLVGNLSGGKWDKQQDHARRVYSDEGISPTITTMGGGNTEPKVLTEERMRKLTPRECFRLMDFPESFKYEVSDTQAYKQDGNSICVGVLCKIIERFRL